MTFKWENHFDRWFDSLSVDVQVLLALSPLITIGVVLTIIGFVFG